MTHEHMHEPSDMDEYEFDQLLNEESEEAEREAAEDTYCPTCSGSGEGQYEGTRCPACKGSGVYNDRD